MRPNERIKEAQRVLEAEATAIFESSKKIDYNFSECVDLIIKCEGTLIISGVGKSGNIGKKNNFYTCFIRDSINFFTPYRRFSRGYRNIKKK